MRARQQGFVAARIFRSDLSMPLAASPHLALCMAHEQDLQHRVLKAAKMKPMIVNSKLSSMVVKRSDLGAEAWQTADGHRSKSSSTLLPGLPRHIRMNCI